MSLPASRNTTYAGGSQVKSADLNDLQDKVVDLNGGKHGTRPRIVPWHFGILPADGREPLLEYTTGAFFDGVFQNVQIELWPCLDQGERLVSLQWKTYQVAVATNDWTFKLYVASLTDPDVAPTQLGSTLTVTNEAAGAWHTNTITVPSSGRVLAADEFFFGILDPGGSFNDAAFKLTPVKMVFDHP